MSETTPFTFATDIEVRFSDLDAYGHVNNAVFFTYLETARTKLFLEKFLDFMNDGLFFLVAKAECEYKKPIDLTDRVVVDMSVTRIGNASFDIDYSMHNGNGIVFALAKTVMVCFDRSVNRPTTLPDPLRQAFCGEMRLA
jgi:acyl-CoA thioester hydrolase